jgi:hypothetical protein
LAALSQFNRINGLHISWPVREQVSSG